MIGETNFIKFLQYKKVTKKLTVPYTHRLHVIFFCYNRLFVKPQAKLMIYP